MSKLDYYVIDTETTGLKAGYQEIHQISIIRVKDKVQLSKDILCSYPKRVNFDALKMTSKSINDLIKVGDTRLNVVSTINEMIYQDGNCPNGRVIIAFNGAFDRRHLHALWEKCNKNFPAHLWLDPLKMMRKYAKTQNWGKVSLKLENACNLLNIKKTGSMHTAKFDTRQTYFLYKKLVDEFGMDYLPYIETHPHNVVPSTQTEYDDNDLSILDDIGDF